MKKIGLIAGNRKFPFLFAQAARNKGYYVVACAIKGDTSRALSKFVDKIYWLSLSDFSRMFEIFKSENIKEIVMAGQISPRRLFSKEINKDPNLKQILLEIKDKKADTIFRAIADKLKKSGFELLNSVSLIEEYLPAKGVLTLAQPCESDWDDINFGLALAKEIGRLDIGQTVAVKSKTVVAVEAFEGTDNLIRRAGKLSCGGITIVKVSKPNQDMRFDVPVVGVNTIKNLIRAKAKCLAIEAGKTLFIDKDESIRFADRAGLIVIAA